MYKYDLGARAMPEQRRLRPSGGEKLDGFAKVSTGNRQFDVHMES